MFPLTKKLLAYYLKSPSRYWSTTKFIEGLRNLCVCVHMCSQSTMRGTEPSCWWWWSRIKLTWPVGSPPRRPPLLVLLSQCWMSMRPPCSRPILKSSALKRECLLTPPSLLSLHWIQTASSSRLSGREEWQEVLLSVWLKLRVSIFLSDRKCQSFMFFLAQTHT